jgi:hypothetical protein
MRRSFATKRVPAAALGLVIMPLMANIGAAEPIAPASTETNAVSAPATEHTDSVVDGVVEGVAVDAQACATSERACSDDADLEKARAYVLETARPGDTMTRQGPRVAIERLNPEFVTRLAAAIREARTSGLSEAGVFSAYRPPAFGIGGFKDKFNSLHSYGLAVDMYGIGSAGSSEAKRWHQIAAKHGVVCPYGPNNRAEWNHCQPTRTKMIQANNPLRRTIVASGPVSRAGMFDAGKALIEGVASLFSAFTSGLPGVDRGNQAVAYNAQRMRRFRIADAGSARQSRQLRLNGRKGERTKVAHNATKTKTAKAGAARATKTAQLDATHTRVRAAKRVTKSQRS